MSRNKEMLEIIMIITALLAACTFQPTATPSTLPSQGDNLYAPQPGDANMMQSKVEIVSAAVVMSESFPAVVSVSLQYRLPTPCNQLRVTINPPDNANRILLEIHSVAPKDQPCPQMELATPQQASINLGSYPTGQFTVWINGVQAGEFTAQ